MHVGKFVLRFCRHMTSSAIASTSRSLLACDSIARRHVRHLPSPMTSVLPLLTSTPAPPVTPPTQRFASATAAAAFRHSSRLAATGDSDGFETGIIRGAGVKFSDAAALRLRRRALLAWQPGSPSKVLIVKKPRNPAASAKMKEIGDWLQARGLEVFVERVVWSTEFKEFSQFDPKTNSQDIDFCITLGGDGTVLYMVSLFEEDEPLPPVLCFAMGSLGFLTPFDAGAFVPTLERVLDTSSTPLFTTLRTRKRCEVVYDGRLEAVHHVLNECVLDRGAFPGAVLLEIFVDGSYVTNVEADGLIISTPSGSTAYSMSAGGPVVAPSVPCTVCTPIAPLSLSFRPLVIPESSSICIHLPTCARSHARASFDGKRPMRVRRGTSIFFTTSLCPLPVISLGRMDTDWYNSITSKLKWNQAIRQLPSRPTPKGARQQEICSALHDRAVSSSASAAAATASSASRNGDGEGAVPAALSELCSLVDAEPVLGRAMGSSGSVSGGEEAEAGAGAGAGSRAGGDGGSGSGSDGWGGADGGGVLAGTGRVGVLSSLNGYEGTTVSMADATTGNGHGHGQGASGGRGFTGVAARASNGTAPATPTAPAASTPGAPGGTSATTSAETGTTFRPPTPATASTYASLSSAEPPSPSTSIDAPATSHHTPNPALPQPPPLSDLSVRINALASYPPHHPYLEGSITDSMMDSLDDPEAFAAAVSAEDATARTAAAAAAVVAAKGGVVRGRSAVEEAVEVMSSGDGQLGQLAAAAVAEEEEEAEAAREAGLHPPSTPPPRAS